MSAQPTFSFLEMSPCEYHAQRAVNALSALLLNQMKGGTADGAVWESGVSS